MPARRALQFFDYPPSLHVEGFLDDVEVAEIVDNGLPLLVGKAEPHAEGAGKLPLDVPGAVLHFAEAFEKPVESRRSLRREGEGLEVLGGKVLVELLDALSLLSINIDRALCLIRLDAGNPVEKGSVHVLQGGALGQLRPEGDFGASREYKIQCLVYVGKRQTSDAGNHHLTS